MGKEEHASDLDRKAFTYWANKVLRDHGLEPITDLAVDFAVGSFFLKFIELVSGKQVPKDTNKLKVLTCVASLNKTARRDTVQSISPNHDSIALGIYFLVFVEHLHLKRSCCRKGNAKEVMASVLKHSHHRIKNVSKAMMDGSALVAVVEQFRADIADQADIKQAANGEAKALAVLSAVAESYDLPAILEEGDLAAADVKNDSRGLHMVLALIVDTVTPARPVVSSTGTSPAGSRVGPSASSPADEAELVGLRLKVAGLERQLARVEAAAGKLQMMVSLMLSDQDSVGAARAAEMRAVERIAVLEQNSDFLKAQLEEAHLNIRHMESKLQATNEVLFPELSEEMMAFPDGMKDADKIVHLQQLVVMYKQELRAVAERNHIFSQANDELSASNLSLTKELHSVRQKKVELQKLLVSSKMKVGPEPAPRRSAPTRTGVATPLRARTGTDVPGKGKVLISKERSSTTSDDRGLKRSLSAVITDHSVTKDHTDRAATLKKSITSMGDSASTEALIEIRVDDVVDHSRKSRSKRRSSKDERSSSKKRRRSSSANSSHDDVSPSEKDKRTRKTRREKQEVCMENSSDSDSVSTPRRAFSGSRVQLLSPRRAPSPRNDSEDLIGELDEILDLVDKV